MSENQNNKYEISAVADAITLIIHILNSHDNLSLGQLTTHLRFNKNKTFRLLATLEQYGLVEKDDKSKYTFGVASLEIARKIISKRSTLDYVRPYLKEVSDLVNESTYFAYIGPKNMLLVDFIDCSHHIKVASLVGRSVMIPGLTTFSAQINNFEGTINILVDKGGVDPEVTAVIASIGIDSGARCGAIVVVAPNNRMQMVRIQTEIIPVLKKILKSHYKPKSDVPIPILSRQRSTK